MAIKDNLTNPTAPKKDNDILIPDTSIDPGIQTYYHWYYRVTVKSERGTLLSGVEMYDSSNNNVGTSNSSGKIAYYAGKTSESDVTFSNTFTGVI